MSFTPAEQDRIELQNDARRFELWERNYSIVHGTAAAVQYALTVGLERIAVYTKNLAVIMRDQLREAPEVRIMDQGEMLGAIVTFYIPGQAPNKLLHQLREQKIHSSTSWGAYAQYDMARKQVPWAIRWSTHYYNTIEEIIQATKEIFKIIC